MKKIKETVKTYDPTGKCIKEVITEYDDGADCSRCTRGTGWCPCRPYQYPISWTTNTTEPLTGVTTSTTNSSSVSLGQYASIGGSGSSYTK